MNYYPLAQGEENNSTGISGVDFMIEISNSTSYEENSPLFLKIYRDLFDPFADEAVFIALNGNFFVANTLGYALFGYVDVKR